MPDGTIDIGLQVHPDKATTQKSAQALGKLLESEIGKSTGKVDEKLLKLQTSAVKANKNTESLLKTVKELENSKIDLDKQLGKTIDESRDIAEALKKAKEVKDNTSALDYDAYNQATQQVTELTEQYKELTSKTTDYVSQLTKVSESYDTAVGKLETAVNEERLRIAAVTEYNAKLAESNALAEEKARTEANALAEKKALADAKAEEQANAKALADANAKALAEEKATIGLQRFVDKAREASASVDDITTALAKLIARQAELETFSLDNTEEYSRITSQIAELQNRLSSLKDASAGIDTTTSSMGRLNSASVSLASVLTEAGNSAKRLVSSFTGVISGAITSGISRLKDSVLKLTEGANQSEFSFKKLFTTMLRYGLGIRSVFMLIRRLRSAIVEGVQNLAKFNGGANSTAQAINSLKSSLQYLKNSWGAAFAPILSFVAPILTRLIDMLATAANTIAAFFAVLTGKKTVVRAVKTQTALGGAVGGTAKKLKDEGEQAKKTVSRLAAFDDLDVLDPPEDDTKLDDIADDLGGGGGGGGIGGGFKEVPVESLLSDYLMDLLKRLKEAWKNGNWEEVGLIIAEGLNHALTIVDDWINNTFAPWALLWAERLARILNGVVAGLDWELLGKTFGDGVNAITTALHKFYETFDFSLFGKRLGHGIISAIETIDWDMIGKFLTDKWNAKWAVLSSVWGARSGTTGNSIGSALGKGLADGLEGAIENIDMDAFFSSVRLMIENAADLLMSFLDEFDFDAMYERIQEVTDELLVNVGELIADVDWGELAMKVGYAIGELIGEAIKWVVNTLPSFTADFAVLALTLIEMLIDAILGLVAGVLDVFMDLGRDSVNGMYQGLLEAISGVETWLQENMIDPMVNGVKNLLGIHSPSTVFADIGKSIMDGLFEGIKSMVDKVLSIWEDFKKRAIELFEQLKKSVNETWEKMWTGLKGTINKIIGGVEKFANAVVRAINKVIDALNSLSLDIPAFDTPFGSFEGFSLGLNLGHIGEISIPRLAQGAVIPPNREFLAMLGDQRTGTNIEAPLDVITQAMRDALSEMDFGQSQQYSEMTLDGETFARLIVPYVVSELNRTGYDIQVLEG